MYMGSQGSRGSEGGWWELYDQGAQPPAVPNKNSVGTVLTVPWPLYNTYIMDNPGT